MVVRSGVLFTIAMLMLITFFVSELWREAHRPKLEITQADFNPDFTPCGPRQLAIPVDNSSAVQRHDKESDA